MQKKRSDMIAIACKRASGWSSVTHISLSWFTFPYCSLDMYHRIIGRFFVDTTIIIFNTKYDYLRRTRIVVAQ